MQDKAKAGLAQRMALRQVERSMGKEQGEQAMQQHGEAVKNYLNDNGHIICSLIFEKIGLSPISFEV